MRLPIAPHVLATMISPLMRLWRPTLRIKRINYQSFRDPKIQAQRPVVVLWHDEIFPLILAHENEGMVCVVSQSQDGELLAQVLERFGFLTARGSSSRGGMRALVAAKRLMDQQGIGAIFTADGPRGPRHEVKPGAVFLAARCASPVIPVRVLMHRAKVFHKSWDKFQLPLPFSQCTIIYGDPLYLAANAHQGDNLVPACLRIEQAMKSLGEQ